MKGLPAILGMMLAVSLLFNVVAFVRLADDDTPAVPARGPMAADAHKPLPVERSLEAAPAARNIEPTASVRESVPIPAAASGGKAASSTVALTQPALRNDPKVREVLQASESFNAFWKELDRVVKARSKFDEAKYAQTVTGATAEYLELGDPNRGQFEEAAKAAAGRYAQAKMEHDAAKTALPARDKANPASTTAYQQQKDAIDLRYQNQVKSAVDSLKPYLNLNDARSQEFLSSGEKWLKNLAPKPVK